MWLTVVGAESIVVLLLVGVWLWERRSRRSRRFVKLPLHVLSVVLLAWLTYLSVIGHS
jgi:hypothetical protein